MQGLALMPNDRPEQNKNSKICLSPLWAHLGTISRASSRTSVRSEAKNHLKNFFFQNFSKSGAVRSGLVGGPRDGFTCFESYFRPIGEKIMKIFLSPYGPGATTVIVPIHKPSSRANTQFRQLHRLLPCVAYFI